VCSSDLLCRRRGFIFQSSEIYGGIGGFWDYGPLGTELKRNIKDAWWQDMVRNPPPGPDGASYQMVGVDCSIIMNPKVWEASGHVGGFNDPMVEDSENNKRFRADHLVGAYRTMASSLSDLTTLAHIEGYTPTCTFIANNVFEVSDEFVKWAKKNRLEVVEIMEDETALPLVSVASVKNKKENDSMEYWVLKAVPMEFIEKHAASIPSPFSGESGSLTEPRMFNLMFETYVGAIRDENSKAYLRPETAQGIFVNFKNVMDSTRVKIPFGIAQIGKAFRNEINPRNFTFRSREFEQMEIGRASCRERV